MDGKFFENNLFAVAGDTGRRLEVQLLDSNNMVQNTTGISLRLNADVAGQATYAEATLVDATKGLYELDLPNGMLIAPGNWQFQWQIIGATGEKLHSFAFMGSIGSNLSEGGSEATNFYLNVDDLKQMQEDFINGAFDSTVLETNITEKLTNLETQYAPKLTEVTAQSAHTDNVVDAYISPSNFDNLESAIDFAKENKKIIKADTITLTNNTNLQGVGLEIENIALNGFELTIGGNNLNTDGSLNLINPAQTIENIFGIGGERGKLFVRGASYQNINIGHYNGFVEFRMNDFDSGRGILDSRIANESFMAYSVFNLRNIYGIDVKNDVGAGVSFPSMSLWFNENTFNLKNTYFFYLDGSYSHNLNIINSGCFEGSSIIEIKRGQDNVFKNIRAEGNLKVIFGDQTSNNSVELQHSWYRPTIDNKGYNNRLVNKKDLEMRLIDSHSIIAPRFGKAEDTVAYNLYPFKNLAIDSSGDCFKTTTLTPETVLYESAFIENPEEIRFLVESNMKRARGMVVTYHLFDANYVDITNTITSQFYALTTAESDYNENDIGLFIKPGARAFNSNFASGYIKNDVLNLIPTSHWITSADRDKPKYVKFLVKYGNAQSQESETNYFQIYDMRVSIYDYSANYRDKYDYNFKTI